MPQCLCSTVLLPLTCSPADPRSVRRRRSSAPATRWARTARSAACCRTTAPTGCRAALRSPACSADVEVYRDHRYTNGTALMKHRNPAGRRVLIPVPWVPAGWGPGPCLSSLCPSNTSPRSPLWTCRWRKRWRERLPHESWICAEISINETKKLLQNTKK